MGTAANYMRETGAYTHDVHDSFPDFFDLVVRLRLLNNALSSANNKEIGHATVGRLGFR